MQILCTKLIISQKPAPVRITRVSSWHRAISIGTYRKSWRNEYSQVCRHEGSRDVPRELAITRSFARTLVTPQISRLNLQVAGSRYLEVVARDRIVRVHRSFYKRMRGLCAHVATRVYTSAGPLLSAGRAAWPRRGVN